MTLLGLDDPLVNMSIYAYPSVIYKIAISLEK